MVASISSLTLQVSFAKEPYKRGYILQKRPIILKSLLHVATPQNPHRSLHDMGWLRLVGSLKLQVTFAKEPYKRDAILQKRRTILKSLQVVITPQNPQRSLHGRNVFYLSRFLSHSLSCSERDINIYIHTYIQGEIATVRIRLWGCMYGYISV